MDIINIVNYLGITTLLICKVFVANAKYFLTEARSKVKIKTTKTIVFV